MTKMNYGIVRHSFWTGPTGRQLRGDSDAQVLAFYLMTSPHANSLGVYRCPLQHMAYETGCPIEGTTKGLRRLSEVGFCTFDDVTETVWVHEMARYQIGDSLKPKDKRQIHIQRIFAAIENPLILKRFFEKYGTAYQLSMPARPPQTGSPNEGASKIHQSPIEANIKFNINGGGGERAHEPERGKSLIDPEIFELSAKVLVAMGHDPAGPLSVGAPYTVQTWRNGGWSDDCILAGVKLGMQSRRGVAPETLKYFEKAIARLHAEPSRAVSIAENQPQENNHASTTQVAYGGGGFATIAARLRAKQAAG